MDSSLAGDAALLVGAGLLAVAVVLAVVAERFRAPALLVFLALGMAAGDDALGIVSFDDAALAQRIAVVALVVILFEGGLSTSLTAVRPVAAPAVVLATVGVGITGAVVAVALVVLTSTDATTAALIGAVVASTDAAAVFTVLRQAPVRPRLASLLEAESGGNDPMAVLLTIGILATWQADPTPADWLVFGLVQVTGGVVVGVALGWVAGWALRAFPTDSTTLHAVLALAAAGLAYGLGALVGASGFLAVFVAGMLVGAGSPRHRRAVRRFFEGMATLAQISLFLMLGLLVFPSRLPDVVGVGVVVAIALLVVARPVAVAACLTWFRYGWREQAFVAWAGLRGAVPIVLATIPLTAAYPDGSLVFDAVFFVVLTSAIVQGLTIGPLARRLDLAGPDTTRDLIADLVPLDAVGVDVLEVELVRDHRVVGRPIRDVPLPPQVRIGAILRGREVQVPEGDSVLEADDLLIVVAPSDDRVGEELERWARGVAEPRGGGRPAGASTVSSPRRRWPGMRRAADRVPRPVTTNPSTPSDPGRIVRLVGVYHADGTPWGELSYWLKARVGGAHCALCDITHGTFREKDDWRRCRSALAVPFSTVHLDERDDDLRAATDGATPCVVAETADGLVVLVDDAELRRCDGSPACLVAAVEANAARLGLSLG